MVTYQPDNSYYKKLSILGECCNGLAIVYLAKHVPSQKLVALKKFNMDKAKHANLIQQEVILTRQLQHSNILPYFVSYVIDQEVCVISPLMEFGSCRDLLNTHFIEGLPESAIAIIIKDVLEGLDYIHKKGFIHRALRASHILISQTGHVCLSGLRYSCPIIYNGKWQKQIHSFPESTMENLNWLGPEVLEQNLQGYNEKSDIYSIGVVLCELANGTEPFAGMPITLMLIEKVRGAAPQLLDSATIPIEENDEINGYTLNQANRRFSEGLHQIAALCLQREPSHRPSASQLLTHSYMKVHRRGLSLPHLLKPAIPLSDKVAYNPDEVADLETIQRLNDLEISSYEWNF
ncbi:STE20-related kinase adapter protein alpha [Agrilus planipennis]|uniref:STE20-related kinase adapter protein alpha n=1 Tax=Agrilus planipennis TaxID=224129 RepID=A0A1W4WK89_AGRPL|nr:STE20-related kinase adapter protein alpha [Agrilus planipennis]XP_018324330.1 STE20-related kinase adapter protein alpha [Agrilus planipennis]XP_025829206.1 STE20-related kinase adapter protein alpha [Agrilus planipennis]